MIGNDNSHPAFELDLDSEQPENFQPVEGSQGKTSTPESGPESIDELLSDATESWLDEIQDSSSKQKLSELYIRLGQAIHEDNSERVEELEAEIAKLRERLTPSYEIPDTPYPSPLARGAYHGLAGEIIGAVEPNSEADPVALLINLLTAYGSAIGDGAWVTVGADRHKCNLFCASVGDTGKGRKGTSWGPVRKLFEAAETEWAKHKIHSGLTSGEGLIYHVRDEVYEKKPDKTTGICKQIDEGVQDKRLLVMEGELAQALKVISREGNTLSPVLRNAWDGSKLQTLAKNSPVAATGAHISILGHITRQELLKGLGETETGNGFANRFLWFCVKRSKALPFGGDYSSIDMDGLSGKLMEAVDFGKQAGPVSWAAGTRPLWAEIYPSLSEGSPGLVGAITARAEAQVIRLACIYALLDCSTEIEPEHLRAAIAIWSYAEASVKYIFQGKAVDPLANKILEALAGRPRGMTRTEISNALGRNYSKARISEALDALKDLGWAESKPTATEGGRRVERWILIHSANEMYELNE